MIKPKSSHSFLFNFFFFLFVFWCQYGVSEEHASIKDFLKNVSELTKEEINNRYWDNLLCVLSSNHVDRQEAANKHDELYIGDVVINDKGEITCEYQGRFHSGSAVSDFQWLDISYENLDKLVAFSDEELCSMPTIFSYREMMGVDNDVDSVCACRPKNGVIRWGYSSNADSSIDGQQSKAGCSCNIALYAKGYGSRFYKARDSGWSCEKPETALRYYNNAGEMKECNCYGDLEYQVDEALKVLEKEYGDNLARDKQSDSYLCFNQKVSCGHEEEATALQCYNRGKKMEMSAIISRCLVKLENELGHDLSNCRFTSDTTGNWIEYKNDLMEPEEYSEKDSQQEDMVFSYIKRLEIARVYSRRSSTCMFNAPACRANNLGSMTEEECAKKALESRVYKGYARDEYGTCTLIERYWNTRDTSGRNKVYIRIDNAEGDLDKLRCEPLDVSTGECKGK